MKQYTYKELTEVIIPAIKRTMFLTKTSVYGEHKDQFWERKLKEAIKQLEDIIEKRQDYEWMLEVHNAK